MKRDGLFKYEAKSFRQPTDKIIRSVFGKEVLFSHGGICLTVQNCLFNVRTGEDNAFIQARNKDCLFKKRTRNIFAKESEEIFIAAQATNVYSSRE